MSDQVVPLAALILDEPERDALIQISEYLLRIAEVLEKFSDMSFTIEQRR